MHLLPVAGLFLLAQAPVAVDTQRRCFGTPAVQPGDEYRLTREILLHPVEYGARITHPPNLPREPAEVFARVANLDEPLRGCYRWARFRRAALGRAVVSLAIQVDPSGRATSVRASDAPAVAGEMVACIAGVLTDQRLAEYAPRTAEVTIHLRFEPSGQRRPPAAPHRPRPARQEGWRNSACADAPRALPHDVVEHTSAVLILNDWDADQDRREATQEHRRAMAAWRRGGRRGMAPRERLESITCRTGLRGRPPEWQIEAAILGNLGAYRSCYAEALRAPGVSPRWGGGLAFTMVLDGAGHLRWARNWGVCGNNYRFEGCLSRALEQVHLYPALHARSARVNVSFRLEPQPPALPPAQTPDPISGGEARARALIAVEDGEGALRAYQTLLREAPTHPRACQWHVGQVQAAAVAAAWSNHPLVDETIAQLHRFVAVHPAASTNECRVTAAPIVRRIAEGQRALGLKLRAPAVLARAVGRFRQLLAFQPPLPSHFWLRASLASMLRLGQQWEEAAIELAGLVEEWPAYARDVTAYNQTAREALIALGHTLNLAIPQARDQLRIEVVPRRPRQVLCALARRLLQHPVAREEELQDRVGRLLMVCPP